LDFAKSQKHMVFDDPACGSPNHGLDKQNRIRFRVIPFTLYAKWLWRVSPLC
jgi:hypothetical protein